MSDEAKTPERLLAEERDRIETILTAAVECLPFGFFALDAEGRYIMQNAANRALWGDIVGKQPPEVAPDAETLSVWLDNNRRAFAGEKVEGDVQIAIQGKVRFYHNVIAPIRQAGQIPGILGVNIDITDRKRAETALRESEERFQAFMDNAPSIAWMKDEHGRFVYRSRPAEKRYGLRREDWLGKTEFDLWPKAVAEQLRKNDLAVLASGQVLEAFEESVGPGGDVIHWWTFKFPFRDASGKRYVGGVAVDITARRRAEAALRDSEQRFRTVLENSLDAAYRRNLAANECDYMSPAIEHLTGFTAEEMARMSLTDMLARIHPDDASRVSDAIAQATEGKTATGVLEYRFRGKDDDYRWLADRFRVLRDSEGQPLYLLGIVRDITDRKRTEAALKQARDEMEQRVQQRTAELSAANGQLRVFQRFADAAEQGFAMADFSGRIAYVNPTLCRFLGEDRPEDAVGKHVSDYLPEEYLRVRQSEIVPALLQGGYWHGEHVLLPRHGKAIPVLQNSFLLRDEKGDPFRVATVFTDISEQKKTQEALERQRRTLERLFRSSDHERQTIAYEIHDGLAQFLAGAIMHFDASEHLKETAPKDAAKAFETGMMMLRQSHAEARRLISGGQPPILDEEGIVAAVAHLIHERRGLGGPKIEFHSLVEFDRLVAIQESTIYRIVQEGLTNACKHSQSKSVRVELVQQGATVRIVVQDWGVGFDPGQIGEQGYGLEGIRERARLLGGQCSVESIPGEGTRLTVELPLVARENDEERGINDER